MKKISKINDLCLGCTRCEQVCSELYYKQNNRDKSSIRIRSTNGGYSINVCSQCGVCVEICPAAAIYRDKNGVIRIKKDLCVGCLICVGFCPEEAMFQHDDYLEPFKCVACGQCVQECPAGAISIDGD